MTLKKTLPMPALPDGAPPVSRTLPSERTREIENDEGMSTDEPSPAAEAPGVPRPITADDITVPVCSSIESSLTFEVLRRQSTDDDEGEKK